MQVGGPAEPRQQRRVLDRVPPPEAPPSEHLVGPPCAEHDADRQQRPGHEGPAPGLDLPAVPHPAGRQHADGEGEWHGEADEPEVEQRRVDGHERVVLEQGVRPRTRGGDRAHHRVERVGRAGHQPEEEGGHDVHDERRPADHRIASLGPVAPDEGGGERAESERPEQYGAGQCRPEPGDRVEERRGPGVVVGHEGDSEVVADEGVLHGECGEDPARQDQYGVGAGIEADVDLAACGRSAQRHRADRDPDERGGEAQPDPDVAEGGVHAPTRLAGRDRRSPGLVIAQCRWRPGRGRGGSRCSRRSASP